MSQHVLVVGAGPGGLAAGMLLAKAGVDVTILEQQPRVGGRTSSIEAQGFRFDLGPTFFLFPLSLQRIFTAAGRDLQKEVPMVRLDPQYRLVFGSGGSISATPHVGKMEQEIARLSPADAPMFRRFLAENRLKLGRFQRVLESPFLSWKALLHPSMLRMLPLLRPWLSLDGELGRYFADPRIRLAFSFQSKYLGMSPFNCPSLFSILSFLEYEHGVHHPIGGCAAVTARMAEIVEELGGEVRCGEPVREILFNGRRAVGVRTDQGVIKADCVVINADFANAMTKLVPLPLRRRWSDQRIAKKRFSCSTFMMYLGVEGVYDRLDHHTIYMARDYEQNLDDIERRHVLSEDPSFYVQNACVTDSSLAPAGASTLYLLAPVSHRHPNINWDVERSRFRARLLKSVEEKLGLSNLEKRIRFEKVVTPDDWENNYSVYRGATFNLAHNLGQMLHLRPRNRFEELDGVYLVGGGTHPGSGLPVIFESARISARLLLTDLGRPSDFIDVPASLEVPEYVG